MVLDSLKGVAVPKSVRLMWQSTISMGKNFLVHLTSGQKGHLAVGEKGKQLLELAPCTFAACEYSQAR